MSDTFPAAVYARTVLSVNFADARHYFLDALLELSAAHAIMLARQDIITTAEARAGVEALSALASGERRARLDAAVFDGSVEDLFFHVEQQMIAAVGLDMAGKLHTARSRNDIDLTEYRMVLRREVLGCAAGVHRLAEALIKLAREHTTALMPALTHTQPAQPTTLGHYLAAAIECFVRDGGRLQAVFATVNQNPLGACAITTTGFPIDRELTAELLGFEGLQLNSYGAIAAIDYLTATAGAIAVAMVNVGKLVQDLLQWCTVEVGYLRLGNAWVQTSSIMPQKRNPVSLEHTRILASKGLAQAQGVFTCAHNTPFGDIVDSEDDLQPLALGMTTDAQRALDLLAGLLGDCSFNTERMRARAHENFLTVTELADTLARRGGLGFRVAHHLVSEAVKASADESVLLDNVRRLAPEITGAPLRLTEAEAREALDPDHFVAIRNMPGGPAPEALEAALDQYGAELERQQGWLAGKRRLLDAYPERIRQAASEL
ncbi:MAG TPA: argininosuccinate lyase [Terriglobales bacterium]|jgi:argininosuccinate lyase